MSEPAPPYAPSIKLRSFLQMAPYLASRGVSPLEFFKRLGISPNIFQNPDIWLPRQACFHIANEMARITQDPFGGAHVGQLTELRSLGAWGHLVLRSANIAQACAMAANNAEMLHQGGRVRIVTEGRSTRLVHSFTGRLDADPRQFILGSLAVLRKIPLMAGNASAIRVHLKTPRTRGDDALETSLGPNIVTGAEHDMIEFDRDLLDSPLRTLKDDASKITAALECAINTASLLATHMSDQDKARLAWIARTIGLSPRTLQRRLKSSGVDFDALHDETRRCEALRLMGQHRYSATEIAYMIGYSDPSHFTRAFKRWTGQNPARFRAALRHRA
ncbi:MULTISPECIES: AraC family transcriptional regulator [Achromobacter]|uniref:HTH-type transcriptional regulator VirS n=2 Tax=root TaxID=1 RepID=A0A6J4ZLT9_9BURK|nr:MULTISPECIES: AraC family transcriptional regulator [Achromobacter]CAB3636308.1 HTH-type transcriptional regulator VirS [Achromobacter insuavis]CUI66942.1 Urease operon transcriptional activator [Achromobacter sp. 2789STDY5608628]CUI79763.1 Urease operon transcriptional activator [Achromobacter sp. 2789STDY5608633]